MIIRPFPPQLADHRIGGPAPTPGPAPAPAPKEKPATLEAPKPVTEQKPQVDTQDLLAKITEVTSKPGEAWKELVPKELPDAKTAGQELLDLLAGKAAPALDGLAAAQKTMQDMQTLQGLQTKLGEEQSHIQTLREQMAKTEEDLKSGVLDVGAEQQELAKLKQQSQELDAAVQQAAKDAGALQDAGKALKDDVAQLRQAKNQFGDLLPAGLGGSVDGMLDHADKAADAAGRAAALVQKTAGDVHELNEAIQGASLTSLGAGAVGSLVGLGGDYTKIQELKQRCENDAGAIDQEVQTAQREADQATGGLGSWLAPSPPRLDAGLAANPEPPKVQVMPGLELPVPELPAIDPGLLQT